MRKICAVCEVPFNDGESVVAVMLSTYRMIDSDVSFAITEPTDCLEIIHHGCYDWEAYPEDRSTDMS
jgi:hypothetical protein